jgi:hypothetical protein
MRIRRVRFTLGRLMVFVAVVAVLLALFRTAPVWACAGIALWVIAHIRAGIILRRADSRLVSLAGVVTRSVFFAVPVLVAFVAPGALILPSVSAHEPPERLWSALVLSLVTGLFWASLVLRATLPPCSALSNRPGNGPSKVE